MKVAIQLIACLVASFCVAARGEEPLVYFDLAACIASMPDDSVMHYDALKLTASLQGLVNRDAPQLIIRFLEGQGQGGVISIDDYWLEKMRAGWLRDREILRESSLAAVLKRFADVSPGWVLWDPNVPATANVAATMCGVDGLLPMRANSPLLEHLKRDGIDLPVKASLAGKFDGSESGSAKCDAYLWAKREYLDAGKCHPALMAFYIDGYSQRPGEPGFRYLDLPNTKVANHDYFIANRAFFFDLLVWPDEVPVDDPNQPLGADRSVLGQLLESQYRRNGGEAITTIGGFVSWDLKYTNHGPAGGKKHPVHTEWEYAALFSAHNAILDADALGLACLTNASAYRHYPLRDRYQQHSRPEVPPLEEKTYVLIYMGDYDSSAWLSRHIPLFWDDPERGSMPIAWAFNPNLSDRVPYVFDYLYQTASPKDWFIAGDSGAGYLNPNLLVGDRLGSGLPEALALWEKHNRSYFEKFDYSITGFVINGFHGAMSLRVQEAYARFSPDGVGMQLGFDRELVGSTPFIRHSADIYPRQDNVKQAADEMAAFAKDAKPQFLVFRWILQSPSMLKQVRAALEEHHPEHNWEFCDPYTFFDLYRRQLSGKTAP